MNSAIHLSQSLLPVAPVRLSSSSRVHVSLSHGFSSDSQCFKRGHLQVSRPLNPKPNRAYVLRPPNSSQEDGSALDSLRHLVLSHDSTEPDYHKIEALKLYAMALSYRQPSDAKNKAEKMLHDELDTWKDSSASTPLKVALIELLIYQKKYQKASEELLKLMSDDDYLSGVLSNEIDLLKIIVDCIMEKEKADSDSDSSMSSMPKPKKYS